MWKDKKKVVVDYIVKHSKILFPVAVIAAVALTVSIALTASNADRMAEETGEISSESGEEETAASEITEEIPMVLNENPEITALITSLYNAMALGDEETLNSVCDEILIADMLQYLEKSKYIEMYPALEIYTKPGYEEGSTIAFVYYRVVFDGHEEEVPGYSAYYICENEQGELYINRGEISEEANEYVGSIMSQDDVVEFNNRVNVEYNNLMSEHPEILSFLSEMNAQVNAAVGTKIADLNVDTSQEADGTGAEGDASNAGNDENAGNAADPADGEEPADTETPAENVIQYATATTTVNVRSSDSEQADKLGKVSGGTKLQVLEQKVNGWSKVLYEGAEGFIKSEYLQLTESVNGTDVIGTVTASTNINVRASASESAERLGVLAGGESVDLLANENGWCKINYNGKVGYVKADYVE